MRDELDNEILERLRSEDPAAGHPESPGERDAVRSRIVARLEAGGGPPGRSIRPRIAIALGLALIVTGVGLTLLLGGSATGPEPALAIDKGDQWVTLTIEDPTASDAHMNSELAAAGIDRVRVRSVPGPEKGVGTWAGYAEFGPACQGGVNRFGFGVNIPSAGPTTPANRHSAENLIDLAVPKAPKGGGLSVETLGSPYSGASLRIDAKTIDDPRNSAKVLVPIRAKSPQDPPHATQIGASELVALGGVFAEYGKAFEDGRTACSDFGLKPVKLASYPPSGNDWLDLQIADTETGAQAMTNQIRAAGIDGEVRLLPVQPDEVGHYLGLERIPPLPPRYPGAGNRLDVVPHDPGGRMSVKGTELALRLTAFAAFPGDRWVFYVGRAPQGGETPEVVTNEGPEDAEAALKAGCPGGVTLIEPNGGHRTCRSSPDLQLPAP
jgi:hypothetical protein